MKLRLFTGLAIALALGGCSTYGYVGDGGGYYTGAPVTQYRYSGYGYGYGAYGYPSYYSPGLSFGLSYGYPYGYYYPGTAYRPPYYHGRPPYHQQPRPPRPDHGHDGRPGHGGRPDHGGRPERPPVAEGNHPPPLDRAPWRDLERLRRGQDGYAGPRRPSGPGMQGIDGADAASGIAPGQRPGSDGMRQMPPPGYRVSGNRMRMGGMDGVDGGGVAGPRAGAPRSERMQRAPQRSSARSMESGHGGGPGRTATPDTIEP